ncbi:lasso RiPP family leader peptide-containing protein [Isoptericola croceus]|nr:lasso RiPP family leader peptide-containing protein [Isoptericola croceus]
MYEAPRITEAGSVRDLTLAQGINGNDDKFLFFSWGENPSAQS